MGTKLYADLTRGVKKHWYGRPHHSAAGGCFHSLLQQPEDKAKTESAWAEMAQQMAELCQWMEKADTVEKDRFLPTYKRNGEEEELRITFAFGPGGEALRAVQRFGAAFQHRDQGRPRSALTPREGITGLAGSHDTVIESSVHSMPEENESQHFLLNGS